MTKLLIDECLSAELALHAWTSFTPLRAEVAFRELPLTREEFHVIGTNVPPYMPGTRGVPLDASH